MEGSAKEKRTLHRSFWEAIAELGWLGVLWDEDCGGIGLGHVETGIILEELGRALVPSAYLPTLLAGRIIERSLPKEEARAWLESIATGQLALSLTLEDGAGRHETAASCLATPEDSTFRIAGTQAYVPQAADVDRILVSAQVASGECAWFWTDAKDPGVEMEELETMDATRPLYRVSFDGAQARRLGGQEDYAHGWNETEPFYWSALASECVGGSERVLEDTVAYAKERIQFGVPIGSQQAIKHKCADLLVLVEGSRSIASLASRALDERRPDAAHLCSMAKVYTTEAYRDISAEGIQIHGGVGFTWEFDCHLFYKRARANGILGGHADQHREQIANGEGL